MSNIVGVVRQLAREFRVIDDHDLVERLDVRTTATERKAGFKAAVAAGIGFNRRGQFVSAVYEGSHDP